MHHVLTYMKHFYIQNLPLTAPIAIPGVDRDLVVEGIDIIVFEYRAI